MGSTLIACKGARIVTREELAAVPTPAATRSWFPLPHAKVADTAQQLIEEAGYVVSHRQYALERGNHRFFGTFDTYSEIADGVRLSVGVRSSTDQAIPLGLVAGHRVLVCSNLSFSGDLINIRRKHTKRGERDFVHRIAQAVASLEQYKQAEGKRIERLRNWELNNDQADALILRAYERRIIGARELPKVIEEWREPSIDAWKERNAFSMFNTFTGVLGERASRTPQHFAAVTMRLHSLLDPERN